MSFTDDDLCELQNSLIPGHKIPARLSSGMGAISSEYIKALLARLEAAEKAIHYLTQVWEDDRQSIEYTHGIGDEADQSIEDWRKAAGK